MLLEHVYNGLIIVIYLGGVVFWCLYLKKAKF